MLDYQEWTGGQVASTYHDHYVQTRAKLADLAYNGRFDKALDLIEEEKIPNSWRLRTSEEFENKPPSGWTTLHQAALLPTAEISHVERLISLGAYRNLRTLDTNETAYDIAKRSGKSRDFLAALKPVYKRALDEETIKNFQKGLDEVVNDRVNRLIVEHRFRIPPIEVLLEVPTMHIWSPIPGFYGGFHIKLKEDDTLELESFCRVAGGSGMTHMVQKDGTWKCTESGLY
ncbi:hypothetical protein H072_4043 [Dactylellina haptotyla CBS 200.50]|uniref:Ankyrin repeat protein n=1 Tax=Dactylellina haptotyla (strain CBS 200.50) TaxID=1284197 RepID=S8BRA7_DACHA|nr:hypothetical protein H072_4043 [Dactylellina haptotyla CBS 200.50]